MGQKVNPVGFRVGVTHAWGSRWFALSTMIPSLSKYILELM